MYEDLLNAVSNLVHRHVLRELYDMTGAMLARLDQAPAEATPRETNTPRNRFHADEVDLGGSPDPDIKTAPPPLPSTIERRERKRRARERQAKAANGPTAPGAPIAETTAGDSWPALRTRFRDEIKARRLTRRQVGAAVGVIEGSISGWLAPRSAPPNAINLNKVLRWLDEEPPPAAAPGSADWPDLREQLRAVAADRGLSRADIGRALGVDQSAVSGWLAKAHHVQVPRALDRIRAWLASGAAIAPEPKGGEPLAPFTLSETEQAALRGHLSLGADRELRAQFRLTRPVLEQAAGGEHMAGEVIERVRGVLANGAAG